MTKTLQAALVAIGQGPKQPYELYSAMFPAGRFNAQKDTGSSKGGPSRMECAVNFYLGKHARSLVVRERVYDRGRCVGQGAYVLTPQGREMVKGI